MSRVALRRAIGPAMIAASSSVITALALRYIFSLATPAELFAEQATVRIPLNVFETLLSTFGPAAKHLYLISALVAEAGLTALVGLAYVAFRDAAIRRSGSTLRTERLTWGDAPIIVFALWLLSAGLLAPLIGGGFLGSELAGGIAGSLVSQLGPDTVFALIFIALARSNTAAARQSNNAGMSATRLSRREMIQQGATGVALLGAGIALWEALTAGLGAAFGAGPSQATHPNISLSDIPDQINPPPIPAYGAWTPVSGQTAELTPASNFYYVSKNLAGDPALSSGPWRLDIDGMVHKPYSLSYDQLRALPQVSQYHTLECISNEVGGNLMSNGLFVGTKLADALNAAGIQPGAREVVFTAADGYSDSLHLSQALDDRALIVYLLDGEPLPQPHGYPARLLIPGLYGMKNGKWLTKLSVGSGAYSGYWEQRGWTSIAAVKLMSRVDTPHDGDLLVARPTSIAGVAYSGAQGISRVDISVDGGHSWAPANLRRPLGALSWTLWEYPWQPQSGQHIIVVRAIDLAGHVQTPLYAQPLPDGSSGYHAVTVTVR